MGFNGMSIFLCATTVNIAALDFLASHFNFLQISRFFSKKYIHFPLKVCLMNWSGHFNILGNRKFFEKIASMFPRLKFGQIRLDGVNSFEFSPTDDIVSCFVPVSKERGKLPAKLVIMELPSRKLLASKNMLFSTKVEDEVQMFWHPEGDYLGSILNLTKIKRCKVFNFYNESHPENLFKKTKFLNLRIIHF